MSKHQIKLIYYKAILDKCFIDFFNDYNDCFQKFDEKYVLSKDFSRHKLTTIFKKYLVSEIIRLVEPYSIIDPKFYFVIGSCLPKDNLLLKHKDSCYFPNKLQNFIDADFPLKYVLKEQDIQIDLVKFNESLNDLFDDMFSSTRSVLRAFGTQYSNILFIKHKNLDCYSMFKTIKSLYGKSNCWNLQKEKLHDVKPPIIAINDCIDRYVQNKTSMTESDEFKAIAAEVRQFIDEKMSEMRENGQHR